jgi:hypothetical protein
MPHTSRDSRPSSDPCPHGHRALGTITRIFHAEQRGLIQTAEGRRVHFDVHDVIHGNFFELEPGDEVRTEFLLQGETRGLHAVRVQPLAKHHLTD